VGMWCTGHEAGRDGMWQLSADGGEGDQAATKEVAS
jgi:hypothetical protein